MGAARRAGCQHPEDWACGGWRWCGRWRRGRCGVVAQRRTGQGWELETAAGLLQARMLVAADGLGSPLRRAEGLEVEVEVAGPRRFGLRRHFRMAGLHVRRGPGQPAPGGADAGRDARGAVALRAGVPAGLPQVRVADAEPAAAGGQAGAAQTAGALVGLEPACLRAPPGQRHRLADRSLPGVGIPACFRSAASCSSCPCCS